MTELNALIDRLYDQAIQGGQLLAQPAAASAVASEEPNVRRLQRVLAEMGQLLNADDQPELEESPSEEALLRVLNHWEAMMHSLHGIKEHIQSLEQDIAKMQPWGDFDVMKVEQLAAHGCHLRFWKMDATQLSSHLAEPWFTEGNVLVVTQDADSAFFVTVTDSEQRPSVPDDAEEISICPCPVSTLIMLQTRDRDTLKKMETLLGDYALVHYGEVYCAIIKRLPPGTPPPPLPQQHTTLRDKLRQFFKSSKA